MSFEQTIRQPSRGLRYDLKRASYSVKMEVGILELLERKIPREPLSGKNIMTDIEEGQMRFLRRHKLRHALR